MTGKLNWATIRSLTLIVLVLSLGDLLSQLSNYNYCSEEVMGKSECCSVYYFNYITMAKDSAYGFDPSSGLFLVKHCTSFPTGDTGIIKVSHQYDDQQVADFIPWYDGNFNGLAYSLSGGDTIAKVHFINGEKYGTEIQVDDDLLRVNQYVDGKLNGMSYVKNTEKDYFVSCQSYSDGLKDGIYFSMHENGIVKSLLLYKDGVVEDGIYYTFYWDGKLKGTLIYKDGDLENYIRSAPND